MLLAYNLFLLLKFDRLVAQEYRQPIKTFRLKYPFIARRIIRMARSSMKCTSKYALYSQN